MTDSCLARGRADRRTQLGDLSERYWTWETDDGR